MQGGLVISFPPIVIPIFISNLGCPNRCIFCDQTQYSASIAPEAVRAEALSFIGKCREPKKRQRILAFYGGTFTGLDKKLLDEYLKEARRLLDEGVIHGVKASTRPDMVDENIIAKLADAGFVELELGVQSMDDNVLTASGRGHQASHSERAAEIIKSSGLKLGIQIMPGLPLEDGQSFMMTVDKVVAMKPDTARIYPAVVIKNTAMEHMFEEGRYVPLTLDEAVKRAFYAYTSLTGIDAAILRMGLPPGNIDIVSGPYHEAFGMLVAAYGYRLLAKKLCDLTGARLFFAHPSQVPSVIGFKRQNATELNFKVEKDDDVPICSLRAENITVNFRDILDLCFAS